MGREQKRQGKNGALSRGPIFRSACMGMLATQASLGCKDMNMSCFSSRHLGVCSYALDEEDLSNNNY